MSGKRTRNTRLITHDRLLGAFAAVAQAVSQTLDLEQLLDIALAKVLEVMDLDAGLIYLIDLEAREAILKAHQGISEELARELGRVKGEEEEFDRGIEWSEPIFELDKVLGEANLPRIMAAIEKEEIKSFAPAALRSKGVLHGVMVVASHSERGFAPEDIDLLTAIGSQIAVAIENAELFAQTRARAQELKESEESLRLYQDIVNNMQIGLSVYHLENIDDERTLRLAAVNPAVSQIAGTTGGDVGRTIAQSSPGLLETPFPKILAKVVRSGKARDLGETRYGDELVAEAVFSVKAFPLPNNHVGVAFEDVTRRKRAEEELLRHAERLAVTAELTRIITSSLNIEDVYEAFVAGVRKLVDFDHASIALVEEDRLRLLAVSSTVETELGTGRTMPLEETAAAWVVAHKKTNIETDLAKNRQFPIDEAHLRSGLRSAIRLPLFFRGEVIGTFNLSSRRPNAYGPREQEILEELAGQIAVAIQNDRLYDEAKQRKEDLEGAYQQLVGITGALERSKEELEDAYLKMARTLVLTLEARDPYTRGHSERVAQLSRQIAYEMNLPQEEVRKIEAAARLHDLGKIGIPDGILLKPGPITPSERAEIQLHPRRGVDMLRFLGFLDGTLPIIEGHHERYDGGGYPDGHRGEETPLGGRILAVSDAYDAMTSARPYRPAMTSEQAINILREGAGSQWDPKVVDAFLRTFGQSLSEGGNAD